MEFQPVFFMSAFDYIRRTSVRTVCIDIILHLLKKHSAPLNIFCSYCSVKQTALCTRSAALKTKPSLFLRSSEHSIGPFDQICNQAVFQKLERTRKSNLETNIVLQNNN